MTHYAYDADQQTLIASWGTGAGMVASCVALAPEAATADQLLNLTQALGHLSTAAWRTYTHPASATANLADVDSEAWRREQERNSFAEALQGVRGPNLPDGDYLTVNYSPVIESGHRIGRALHAIGDPQLTAKVIVDVEAEIAAIERADLGDLSGRARQAVLLTRQEASPVQVAAADTLLRQDPFGPNELFTHIDPTAAAVAAAHWLQAAADVASEMSGHSPTSVVEEADNIEALPHESPSHVLKLIGEGASPREAVVGLIRDAMHVAEGQVPDVGALLEKISEAQHLVRQHAADDEALAAELLRVRITPLDPQRPARDLLEDLLSGIYGCWLLFQEYADLPEVSADSEEDWDEEEADASLFEQRQNDFIELVRSEAVDGQERLL